MGDGTSFCRFDSRVYMGFPRLHAALIVVSEMIALVWCNCCPLVLFLGWLNTFSNRSDLLVNVNVSVVNLLCAVSRL